MKVMDTHVMNVAIEQEQKIFQAALDLENPRERALFSDPGGIAGARPLRRCDTAFR